MTKVKFIQDAENNLTAYFPQLNYNKMLYGNNMKTCYAHVGQHSGCSKEYVKQCTPATFDQYQNLLEELISIGYSVTVLNKN
jgi:hypothetical protein